MWSGELTPAPHPGRLPGAGVSPGKTRGLEKLMHWEGPGGRERERGREGRREGPRGGQGALGRAMWGQLPRSTARTGLGQGQVRVRVGVRDGEPSAVWEIMKRRKATLPALSPSPGSAGLGSTGSEGPAPADGEAAAGTRVEAKYRLQKVYVSTFPVSWVVSPPRPEPGPRPAAPQGARRCKKLTRHLRAEPHGALARLRGTHLTPKAPGRQRPAPAQAPSEPADRAA